MKLREEILREHSKKQCHKIVRWVGNDKERFAELMQLMLTDEYRVAQRAAYPISYCVQKFPGLIKPWFARMIKKMSDRTAHDAVRRNALRIFEEVEIPEKFCGQIYEMSNNYLHDLREPIAVRAFSITTMYNIARKYPDLLVEVKHNAESLLHCGIPALQARSKNILKEIKKAEK